MSYITVESVRNKIYEVDSDYFDSDNKMWDTPMPSPSTDLKKKQQKNNTPLKWAYHQLPELYFYYVQSPPHHWLQIIKWAKMDSHAY